MKIITITGCDSCPRCQDRPRWAFNVDGSIRARISEWDWGFGCTKTDRYLGLELQDLPAKPPAWCPLPDAPEVSR